MNISSKPGAIDVEIHGNFVDGREVEAGSGEMLDVRNPATGDVIARIPNSTTEDIDRAMKSARAAFEGKAWGGMDTRARARLVNRLADAFEANLDTLYRLETLNNGRPVNETRAQLSRAAGFLSLLRGACAGTPRFGDPGRGFVSQLHPAHAARDRRQLHAVQSSADDPLQVARRGAGDRLRHRGQAVGIHAADDLETGADIH
jgi:acyl-CoA reductase-like NAD-dependent aldehyde dehydrogenase